MAVRGSDDVPRVRMTERRSRAGPAPTEPAGAVGQALPGRGAGGDRPREPAPVAGAVSLWLDTYDDIFSDFDPRAFGHRALSEDFLAEARRAVRDRHDEVPELRLLVSAAARNVDDETIIRKRLRDHFRRHADRLRSERRQAIWMSLGVAMVGFLLMTTSALLRRQPATIGLTVLHVFLEPSGWFAVWFGLDQLFYGSRDIAREQAFYRKMARAEVVFTTYLEEGPAKGSG
jgi:hypothetical protein